MITDTGTGKSGFEDTHSLYDIGLCHESAIICNNHHRDWGARMGVGDHETGRQYLIGMRDVDNVRLR